MYLPSFYKIQLEKYLFNTKRVGLFMVPVVLWSKIFNYNSQSDGHSILNFTTPSTPTFSPQPEESKEEPRINNDTDLQYKNIFIKCPIFFAT